MILATTIDQNEKIYLSVNNEHIVISFDWEFESNDNQLNGPNGIFVTNDGTIYIADSLSDRGNHRIIRWAPNATYGVCIVACTGIAGQASTQLADPHALAFDQIFFERISD